MDPFEPKMVIRDWTITIGGAEGDFPSIIARRDNGLKPRAVSLDATSLKTTVPDKRGLRDLKMYASATLSLNEAEIDLLFNWVRNIIAPVDPTTEQ